MAPGPGIAATLDALIALFNRRSMDLPDGAFSRQTQFLLNGVAFEEMLGRSPSDPLVLMLARGAAGYRFAAKAVQHAVPDARLQRGELTETAADGAHLVTTECWLSGHYRGTGEPAEVLIGIRLELESETIARAHATVDDAALQRLRTARLAS